MARNRRLGFITLVVAGVLVTALVAPGVALALVGEPIPGAEVFLQQQPGDDPIHFDPASGGDHVVNADCALAWPAGVVAAPTDITATVGKSSVGEHATDGGTVFTVVRLVPSGLNFLSPLTLTLTAPPRATNPRLYLQNPVSGKFEPAATVSRNGDKLSTEISHFSTYGIGGDPVTTTSSVPASSPWSLGLLAAFGGAMLFRARRSMRSAA